MSDACNATKSMKTRLTFSWLFLIAGGVYGAYLSYSGQVSADPLASALSTGYGLWGLYWGVPVVLPWWLGLHFGSEWRPRLFKLLLGCILVPFLSYLYGVLGGGLYQFLKTWWKVRG